MTNRIELAISERRPFAGGHVFDDAGPYERIRGRALFTVDPDAQAGALEQRPLQVRSRPQARPARGERVVVPVTR